MPSNNNIKIFDKLVSRAKIYIWIIAILLVTISIMNTVFIVPSIILFSLLVFYSYWVNKKKKVEFIEHIEDITFNMDTAAKTTMINSPFPLIIVETDGEIIWKSSKYVSEFSEINLDNQLIQLLKDIKLEIVNNEKNKNRGTITKEINIGNKVYKLMGMYSKSKNKKIDEYTVTIYFIDVTNSKKLEKNYRDSISCVGVIMIDNYEETMQRISNEDKPQVIANAEKMIYDWLSEYNALVIKNDRDTYICICNQKSLDKMEESKFNILDAIKGIQGAEKMQLTLSIAISNEGENDYEKYKNSLVAMDIALGRGGDQAIVRKNGKYTFFGGRAHEVEKRTKVKARIVSEELEELINKSANVMIMGHVNGDIDSMGSSLGIYRLAKTLDKDAYIVNNTVGLGLQNLLENLNEEGYKDIILDRNESLEMINKDTLLIVVDTHKKGYVEVPELLTKTSNIVVIDHHRRGTDYIENAVLMFHEVYASSAAELVTELLEYSESEIKLAEIEAESLYAGIMTDTKNFTFKTGVRTFEAAAFLRKRGVDIIKVKKWFQSDLKTYNIISTIVQKADVVKDSIAISTYEEEKETGMNVICAKAADELLTISDITASFVLGKLGEKVYISGRSIGDINVQVILEKMGGGGHITLAGAQVEGKTIEEVKEELLGKIDEYFAERD